MKIKYRDLRAYKYQLLETIEVEAGILPHSKAVKTDYIDLDEKGKMTIYAGYCWDGPSGPAFDTDDFLPASLVHDAGYQLIRMGMFPSDRRSEWDGLMRRIAMSDGMWTIRADLAYAAVRAAGWAACEPRPEDIAIVKEAP